MHIGIITHNWEKINPATSTNLRIVKECIKRGHKVSIIYTHNFTVRENTVSAIIHSIIPMTKTPDNTLSFYKKVKFDTKLIALHAFDCLLIRKDPPINPIVFNFLDAVKNEVVIINDVDGIRKANNKLYTTTFHDPNHQYFPITHVSGSKKYIKQVIDECADEKMILKPLDGSGGRGVIVLEKSAKSNINSLLDFYIDDKNDNFVILQEYINGAEQGDVRVMMLDGKPIGAYQRKPQAGELRSNVDAGGSTIKYHLTDSQQRICKTVGKKLLTDGIYLAGLDMIGDKILEINVLNPSGNTNLDKFFTIKIQKQIVDFLEEKVSEKLEKHAELEYLLNKLNDLRR
jgi:glutathione synthase